MLDAPRGRRGFGYVRAAIAAGLLVACGGVEDGAARAVDAGVPADFAVADAAVIPDAAVFPDARLRDRDAGADPGPDEVDDAGEPRLGAPYPIVLAHGFFGFEELGGSFLTYFYGVKDDLAAHGETVFTPAVDPFNDSTSRGEELAAAVDAILAETGHAKVVLVGHSQGGLDARYVASTRPDQVAAVVTVSSPHRGTPMIDLVLRAAEDERVREWVDGLVRTVGAPLWDAAGEETSLFHAMEQLSEEGAAAFNAAHPNQPGVDYFSIAGRSGMHLAPGPCASDEAPEWITRYAWERDPIDPLLAVSEAFIDGGFGDPYPNDGLVRIESARWGTFLGCVPADHFDEMGQLLGDSPGLGNRWSYLEFYRDLVGWVRAEGY